MLDEFRTSTRQQMAGNIRLWFFRATKALNAVLTAAFFAQYARALFAPLGAPWDAVASALYGVLIIDGAYLAWRHVAAQSDTAAQARLARGMFVTTAGISVLLSVAWSTLYGIAAVAEVPWFVTATANGIGWVAVILPASMHVVAVLVTQAIGPEARREQLQAEIVHLRHELQARADEALANEHADDLTRILAELAPARREEARDNAWQELRHKLLRAADDAVPAPPPVRPSMAASGPRPPRLEDDAPGG